MASHAPRPPLNPAEEKFPQVTLMEPIVAMKDSAATPAVEMEWIVFR